jgi:hydrogenase nickel incorporation protein HypA/HybF
VHELPITQRIISIASGAARARGAGQITQIQLVVGDVSGYMADSIRLYFDLISAGSLCEGAILSFESVKSMLRCENCGRLFERKPFDFTCPCGGQGRPTEIGREFYVKAIEVKNEPD